MAVIANVALTDTFDLWRTRTNQLAVQSNGFEAYIVNLYERSNNSPTYVYANNIGVQANSYTNAAISAANVAVGNGANAFARTIGISSNSYTNTAISAANVAVGNGANAYSRVIGTSSNGYAVFVGASANSSTDTKVANEAALARNATNLTGGTVALARGGTGTSLSASQGGVVYGTLAGMAINGAGVSGQVLTSAGTSPPTWTAQSSLSVGSAAAATSASQLGGVAAASYARKDIAQSYSGTITVTDGAGVITLNPSGDIYAYRTGGTTGVIFLNSAGNRYLYYDSTTYQMPGAGLNLGGGLSTAGAITATGDITAFSASDKRLKTNISQIQDSLHKVNSISGVTFDWNEEGQKSRQLEEEVFGNRREAGVIAQEIEEVLPEVVVTRKDGYKAVRYEKLVPLLIEAIKELTAKVEMLESKVGK
jgi:hypothetical protein